MHTESMICHSSYSCVKNLGIKKTLNVFYTLFYPRGLYKRLNIYSRLYVYLYIQTTHRGRPNLKSGCHIRGEEHTTTKLTKIKIHLNRETVQKETTQVRRRELKMVFRGKTGDLSTLFQTERIHYHKVYQLRPLTQR